LVGDVDKIPVYEGNTNEIDEEDPTTDLGYSLLEGDDNLADVFLGRFSVEHDSTLKFMINKTIFMEMNMHRFTKKAKFWAGKDHTSNWIYMESEFRRGHNAVIPNFTSLGYDCQKIYHPTDNVEAVNAFSDNPLFYLYTGHGSIYSLNNASYSDFILPDSTSNTVFPCFFAFACKSGHYFSETCMGEGLIRADNKGAVAYFGSSVNSRTMSDVAIEKKIFGDALNLRNLSAMINTGMRRFTYVAGIRDKIKKRYLKAYNLLGDPSFDTKGMGCNQNFTFNYPEIFKQGAKLTYRANNNIENNNSFVVESGADVKLLAGNSVHLKPGFRAEAGSNVHIGIVPCSEGIIQKSDENDEHIFDITEKIMQMEMEEVLHTIVETDEIIYPAIFSVFPNPTNDDFSLAYTLEENSFVQIELYNMQGVFVKNFLQSSQQEAGIHYHNFSLSGLTSGLYILVFKSNSKTISNKIIKH
jgi:hypothetical protein